MHVGCELMGRPSTYSQALADQICDLLAEGLSMRTVCKADDMPDKATVFRWLRTNGEFRDQYARAKEESADAWLEDMFDIADDDDIDVQRAKLRVDVRKWAASKLKPKKYGDKVQHTGADGESPVKHVLETVFVDERTEIDP